MWTCWPFVSERKRNKGNSREVCVCPCLHEYVQYLHMNVRMAEFGVVLTKNTAYMLPLSATTCYNEGFTAELTFTIRTNSPKLHLQNLTPPQQSWQCFGSLYFCFLILLFMALTFHDIIIYTFISFLWNNTPLLIHCISTLYSVSRTISIKVQHGLFL